MPTIDDLLAHSIRAEAKVHEVYHNPHRAGDELAEAEIEALCAIFELLFINQWLLRTPVGMRPANDPDLWPEGHPAP